ncbi:MAG: UDP-N-acetylglucosamine 1-carboxyvinyltransferase [Clostridia bacterium]|nr:UDP-N-acetylglucosamine 1-carboxyvinyltransferase [Clostridia bacterium]
MRIYRINGSGPLNGTVRINGCKNSVVAILPATILVRGVCRLTNVPDISDIRLELKMLEELGAKVDASGLASDNIIEIDTSDLSPKPITADFADKFRASYYFWSVMTARFGRCYSALPGGDDICGKRGRPVNYHTDLLKALGASVIEIPDSYDPKYINISLDDDGLFRGAEIDGRFSVGATINAMLASVLADGPTVIKKAAMEPHIVDVANFLNICGANITGAGTPVIKVGGRDRNYCCSEDYGKEGVRLLHGGEYDVMPDQIEAGTYMLAVAAAGGDVNLENLTPQHLDTVINTLMQCGATIECSFYDMIRVKADRRMDACSITTAPHPGFPTDLQAQFSAMLATANGKSSVTESIWQNRFKYANELVKMGADITRLNDQHIDIFGLDRLRGADTVCPDIRGGAAIIIAALTADGTTTIRGVEHIERGYQDIVGKLSAIGADISIEETED